MSAVDTIPEATCINLEHSNAIKQIIRAFKPGDNVIAAADKLAAIYTTHMYGWNAPFESEDEENILLHLAEGGMRTAPLLEWVVGGEGSEARGINAGFQTKSTFTKGVFDGIWYNYDLNKAEDAQTFERVVRLLVARGANVNAPGFCNETVLTHAVKDVFHRSASVIIPLLLQLGADMNVRTENYNHNNKVHKTGNAYLHRSTPLHMATSFQNRFAIFALLDHGADPLATCHNGRTPRDTLLDMDPHDIVLAALLQAYENKKKAGTHAAGTAGSAQTLYDALREKAVAALAAAI